MECLVKIFDGFTKFTSILVNSQKFLVIIFVLKIYFRNVFKRIKKEHGQDVIKLIISYESLNAEQRKVTADLKFIKL